MRPQNSLKHNDLYEIQNDSFIDTSVGNTEMKDILSVYITPDKLNSLNFDMIDPSDSMANFRCNMKFLKTKGFQPISRITVDE